MAEETLEYWTEQMNAQWAEVKKALAEMPNDPAYVLDNAKDKLDVVQHCLVFSDMAEINPLTFSVLPENIAEDVCQAREVVIKMVDYFFFKQQVESATSRASQDGAL